MLNRGFGKLLSMIFVSTCLCVGISIGSAIRMGKIQASDKVPKPSDSLPILPPVTEEQIFPDSITIQAVGDIIPGTNYPNNRLPRNRNQLIPKSIRTYLGSADILFGNLETSLTNYRYSAKDITRGQTFAFRSPPEYAKLFSDVGFNVFNIANNHALDFGVMGFRDTVNNLKTVGIDTVGHKNQILSLNTHNVKVAMVGFAPYNYYNSIHDVPNATQLVKKAQKQADIVIVSMHAGAEGTNAMRAKNETEYFYGENRGNSVQFARTMIDAGADVVLGHGPHVPRAMEIYKGKLVAYSLGNFLGYRTLSTTAETGYSMILEVKLNSAGDLIAAKIIPIHMDKQGIPRIDQSFRTVKLVRDLIDKDFAKTSIKINKKGEIIAIK